MNVLAIIQARMASTRLPGKVLAEIGGRSMLARVCGRVRLATLVDQVVVATTLEPEDEEVLAECDRLEAACFRGSAEDVLDRYHKAAGAHRADVVVRVTADCPLIDPEVIDLVVGVFLKEREQICSRGNTGSSESELGVAGVKRSEPPVRRVSGGSRSGASRRRPSTPATRVSRMANLELLNVGSRDSPHSTRKRAGPLVADYASNTLERTWPRGLDTEAMTAAALARASREATRPYERTHVTPYIYRHPELFQLLSVTLPSAGHRNAPPNGREDLGQSRWTVDWPEDLDFVRAIYARLADGETFSWRDVQALLTREPALAELNRHVRQKQLVEG
jgi:spore coat polysaccharide biosynthesis protein SpsF (cytidylyltransferase family)